MRRTSLYLALASVPFAMSLSSGCATGVTSPTTSSSGSGASGGSGGAGGEGTTTSSSSSSSSSGSGGCNKAEDCVAFSDACNTGACINGTCGKLAANDGTSCDDGVECTVNTTCQSGVCTGGTLKPCTSQTPCMVGMCDTTTDQCVEVPGANGSPCVDNDACTLTGTCNNGTCVPGGMIDCSFLNGPCAQGFCDPQVGCKVMPLAEGSACPLGNPNPCATGQCTMGMCTPMPVNNGMPCDDGLFCTINDSCQAGQCTGSPNPCTPQGADVCQVGSCNEAANTCTSVPGNNGAACNDNNACTMGETCSNGACNGGVPANQGGACDDGNTCTTNDACNNGACAGVAITQCISNDGCCPSGCTFNNDNDCNCQVNLASSATASVSGGGSSPPYTPSEMNNGVPEGVCQWAWVSNSTAPSGAWAQLQWAQPVTIGSFYIYTENANGGGACGAPAGRNIASATVQWWDGAQWVTATTFSGKTDDVQINLVPAVTTTRLRLYDMTSSPGNGNSLIYEWLVYQAPNCMP